MKNFSYLSLAILLFISHNAFSLENLGNPLQGVYRGARLFQGEEDFASLKKLGVKHIINLESKKDDPSLCAAHNMECHHYGSVLIPWIESITPANTPIVQAYWKVKEILKKGEKVYIHCHWGSDRTGLLVGSLRIAEMMKSLGDKPLPSVHVKALLEELRYHKHHLHLFPGVKLKLKYWTRKAPRWFFSNPSL